MQFIPRRIVINSRSFQWNQPFSQKLVCGARRSDNIESISCYSTENCSLFQCDQHFLRGILFITRVKRNTEFVLPRIVRNCSFARSFFPQRDNKRDSEYFKRKTLFNILQTVIKYVIAATIYGDCKMYFKE